jgi:hypothetical protein
MLQHIRINHHRQTFNKGIDGNTHFGIANIIAYTDKENTVQPSIFSRGTSKCFTESP